MPRSYQLPFDRFVLNIDSIEWPKLKIKKNNQLKIYKLLMFVNATPKNVIWLETN